MKKFVTQDSTIIPEGTVLGLTKRQATDRDHIIEIDLNTDHKVPDGIETYTLTAKTQFKAGEVIYADKGLEKTVARVLLDADGSTDPAKPVKSDQDDQDDQDALDPQDMDRDQLKAHLSANGVEFKARTSTKKLLELALGEG
tara:strand:- start:343 stop:768 length:426 start_codon:yes stop_codon:yes gene_type:complete